jgi:hypothetical protein
MHAIIKMLVWDPREDGPGQMIPKIMEGHVWDSPFKMSGCDLIDVKKVFESLRSCFFKCFFLYILK